LIICTLFSRYIQIQPVIGYRTPSYTATPLKCKENVHLENNAPCEVVSNLIEL